MDRNGRSLLGKYQLERRIGKGGMGEVWEAEHLLTGRRVAVKILGEAHLANTKIVARFGREARAASAVQHPGIVEILDQDVTLEGEPFLVMEYLVGESLGERLRSRGKLTEDAVLRVTLPLLDALSAAHAAGVIHRDLKPDNVFLLPAERGVEQVKILDFGISRKADELAHHLTQEGSVLGTPHYMSPEQARGEVSVDGRADVYAVAVLMYECVTGHVPFDAKNYNALLQRILSEQPQSARARGADVSAAVERVIMRALSKSKTERPASADALRDELVRARDAPDSAPAGSVERPRAAHASLTHELVLGDERDFLHAPVSPAPPRRRGASLEAFEHALAPARETMADSALMLAPSAPTSAAMLRESRGEHTFAISRADDGASAVATAARDEAAEDVRVDVEVLDTKRVLRGAAVVGGASAAERARARRPRGAQPTAQALPREDSALLRGAKSAAGWLMAALAIAALAYTGRLVFARPDARHPRLEGVHGAPAEAAREAAEDSAQRANP